MTNPQKKQYHIVARIVCLLLACVIWFLVAATEGKNFSMTVKDVEVQIVGIESLRLAGYDVVSETVKVSADVTGNRSLVLPVKAKDLKATADVSNLRTTGNVRVPVTVTVDSKIEGVSVLNSESYAVTLTVRALSGS